MGYLGVYVLLIGLCLCLLVGLYALADLVEQHLRTTKRVIIHTVQATVAMLLLLWVLHGEKLDLATMVRTGVRAAEAPACASFWVCRHGCGCGPAKRRTHCGFVGRPLFCPRRPCPAVPCQ